MHKELPKQICTFEPPERHPDLVYYNYYKMKAEGKDNGILSNYIMNTIYPNKLIHNIYKQPMWEVYRLELYDMMEHSKKYYTIYFDYIKKMKKIIEID